MSTGAAGPRLPLYWLMKSIGRMPKKFRRNFKAMIFIGFFAVVRRGVKSMKIGNLVFSFFCK